MAAKRETEVFTVGGPVCNEAIALVQRPAVLPMPKVELALILAAQMRAS